MNTEKRKNEILTKLITIRNGIKQDMVSDVYIKWINQAIQFILEIKQNG